VRSRLRCLNVLLVLDHFALDSVVQYSRDALAALGFSCNAGPVMSQD
jgi:hypothetical protein